MQAMLETAAERLVSTNKRMLRLLAWGLKRHHIEGHL